jgi:hypothetical protein
LATFPKVHAVVLHASICHERDCDQVIGEIKQRHPGMTVIALSPVSSQTFKVADYNVSSHEPQELLNLLRSLFGDPRS